MADDAWNTRDAEGTVQAGLMRRREASTNDVPVREAETRLHRASQRLCETLEDRLSRAFEGVFPFGGMHCEPVTQAVIVRIAVTAAAAQDCAVEMMGKVP